MEKRGKATEDDAVSLMKNQARYTVYSERAASSGNPALKNMADLEVDLLSRSQRSWRTTLGLWTGMTMYERQALVAILIRAKTRARREVAMFFDDQTTKEALGRFFDSFDPEDLIPRKGAS